MSASQVVSTLEACLRLYVNVDSGTLLSESSAILSFSIIDPYQSKSREFLKYYSCTFPCSPGKLVSFSPSRRLRLVLTEGESPQDQFWEVWSSSRMTQVKSLKKSHASLVHQTCFGKLSWSSSESHALYIAEPSAKKGGSYWSEEDPKGEQNLYRDCLGEELWTVSEPQIYLYDLCRNEVKQVGTSEEVYPAQPCFRPGTEEFVYIGFLKKPFKIGVRALLNRDTRLYKSSLCNEGQAEDIKIPERFMAALYPKCSPDGRLLSYFGVPANSISHCMCLSLLVYDFQTSETSIVLDTVEEFREDFNGIYGFNEKLTQYAWVDNQHLAFCSLHNCSEVVFVTDLQGSLSPLRPPLASPSASTILDVHAGAILLKCSSVKSPDQVFIAKKAENWTLELLENTSQAAVGPLEVQVQESLDSCEVIFLQHSTSPNRSILYRNPRAKYLLVSMHGGPHAMAYVDHSPVNSLRLALGFSFLEVNYRGSTGFGEISRRQLVGHMGEVDVADCIEAVQMATALLSQEKTVIHGKSYGGFLGAHLASKISPDASVILAAASNVASLAMHSDMGDWAFANALGQKAEHPPSSEQIRQMYMVSPIRSLGEIRAPVLLATGGIDERVPPGNTMEMYRVLKARGNDVKLLVYKNDGHAFAIKSTALDLVANTFVWILEKIENKGVE